MVIPPAKTGRHKIKRKEVKIIPQTNKLHKKTKKKRKRQTKNVPQIFKEFKILDKPKI